MQGQSTTSYLSPMPYGGVRLVTYAPIEVRFWAKVRVSGACWVWIGAKSPAGYGRLTRGGHAGQTVQAHRFAWELYYGPIPPGLCVLHNCPGGDNPSCVNPPHLWLGSRPENQKDMGRKRRGRLQRYPEQALGSRNNAAKLTEADAIELRALRAAGASYAALAARFHINEGHVYRILVGHNWRHV